jgi:FkbM family methyltransferase
MSVFPRFNHLRQCRYGMMLCNRHDAYIGRSLEHYGEFSEGEAGLFRQLLKPGHVALEVGANIGAHTLLLAQLVGPTGTVLAFEPQRIVFRTLYANMALFSITNVRCVHAALGKASGQITVPCLDHCQDNNFGGVNLSRHAVGESVPVMTIDGLDVQKCDLLKVDVEGMEQEVLEGAVRTTTALSPAL